MPARFFDRLFSYRSDRLGRRFDRLHGVETSDIVGRDGLTGMGPELRQHAGAYIPSNPSLLKRIVRKSAVDPREFSFLDLGCGKGRALFAAADFPFISMVGVEADANVYAAAQRNLECWSRSDARSRVTIVHADARTFEVPAGNLFIFMYSPFRERIFERVAERLGNIASEPDRAVVIAYSADWESDMLERTGQFIRRRLRRRQFWAPPTVSLFYNARADRLRRSGK